MKFSTILLAATLAGTATAPAVVLDYPWPSTAPTSTLYRVRVSQAGVTNALFTHFSQPNLNPGPDGDGVTGVLEDRTMSYVQFAFTGEMEVEVRKLYGTTALRVEIAPKAHAIDPHFFDGRTVRFRLSNLADRTEYLSVNFVAADNQDDDGNGGKNIKHGLMLFGDAPETEVPNTNASNVLVYSPAVSAGQLAAADIVYFPPGDHDLQARYPSNPRMASMPAGKNGQAFYAAGGAFIRGALHGNNKDNLRVYGRGIFTGQFLWWHAIEDSGGNKDAFLNFQGADDCLFEGVVVENPTHHTWPSAQRNTYRNVKVIGWASNHDGLRPAKDSLIDAVFLKSSDDLDYARDKHTGRNSVIWPMRNGAFGQLGWNNLGVGQTTYTNLHFINGEWTGDPAKRNVGVIGSVLQQGVNHSDNVVEHLYGEDALGILAHMTVKFEPGEPWNPANPGEIRNFTFRNIVFEQDFRTPNGTLFRQPIKGFVNAGVTAYIHDIRFINLVVGNVLLTSNNASTYFDIDPVTTYNITFEQQGAFYYVTNTATAGGTLSPPGSVPTPAGMTRTIAVAANAGFRIKNVRVDGVDLGRRQNVTFPNISAHHAVHVEFESAPNDYFDLTPLPVPPDAPADLVTVALATNLIQLAWSDRSTNETGFEIQRAANGSGPWSFLGSTPGDIASYLDSTVMAGTTYFYQVRATNSAGASAWSAPANATTPPPPIPGGGYTNLDTMMSSLVWKPATNPVPPHPDAVINFGNATNLTWNWDDSTGTNATLTCVITRTDTSGPGGADVFFFGGATYAGDVAAMRLAMDVAKSPYNIGTLRFAVRQGTNLFYTSGSLNNVPNDQGIVVNYELTGVQTPTLKTNGVVSQSDLTWDPIHPGTTVDFTNGLPLEFGFCDNAALGTTATSTSRGPILDNFLVEITAPAVPGNQPPVLAPLADRVLGAGQTLWVTNSATDPEVPPQSLVYTLLGAPAGADIQTHSGLVQWRPGVAQGGAVYPVTVRVADNGTPSLSATQSFSVTVTAALAPALSAAAWSGGQFGMTIGGSAGPDYSVLASTNLTDWSVVFSTNPPTVPFPWVDPDSSLQPLRFYQVEIGP